LPSAAVSLQRGRVSAETQRERASAKTQLKRALRVQAPRDARGNDDGQEDGRKQELVDDQLLDLTGRESKRATRRQARPARLRTLLPATQTPPSNCVARVRVHASSRSSSCAAVQKVERRVLRTATAAPVPVTMRPSALYLFVTKPRVSGAARGRLLLHRGCAAAKAHRTKSAAPVRSGCCPAQ
jgi:hypothetical protein